MTLRERAAELACDVINRFKLPGWSSEQRLDMTEAIQDAIAQGTDETAAPLEAGVREAIGALGFLAGRPYCSHHADNLWELVEKLRALVPPEPGDGLSKSEMEKEQSVPLLTKESLEVYTQRIEQRAREEERRRSLEGAAVMVETYRQRELQGSHKDHLLREIAQRIRDLKQDEAGSPPPPQEPGT